MDRQEIIQKVGEWFNLRGGEDGYNINDYDWQSGCYLSGTTNDYGDMHWLSLAVVVDVVKDIIDEYYWED